MSAKGIRFYLEFNPPSYEYGVSKMVYFLEFACFLFGPVLIPIIIFSLVKHVNFPFQRKELRHLDFRKIGVNCRYIQKNEF